jgi:hypothetical protein
MAMSLPAQNSHPSDAQGQAAQTGGCADPCIRKATTLSCAAGCCFGRNNVGKFSKFCRDGQANDFFTARAKPYEMCKLSADSTSS